MLTMLEELKARLAAAQARQAIAQQRYQAAAAEVNAATADFNVWNSAVADEMREEASRAAEAAKNQIPMSLQTSFEETLAVDQTDETRAEQVVEDEEPVNKTNLFREILAHNPPGIAPRPLSPEF